MTVRSNLLVPVLLAAGCQGPAAWALEGAPVLFLNRSGGPVRLRRPEGEGLARREPRAELWVRVGAAGARRMFPPDASFQQDGGALGLAHGEQATLVLHFPEVDPTDEDLTDHYLLAVDTPAGSFTLIYTAAVFRDAGREPEAEGSLEEHLEGAGAGRAILLRPAAVDQPMARLAFFGMRPAGSAPAAVGAQPAGSPQGRVQPGP